MKISESYVLSVQFYAGSKFCVFNTIAALEAFVSIGIENFTIQRLRQSMLFHLVSYNFSSSSDLELLLLLDLTPPQS